METAKEKLKNILKGCYYPLIAIFVALLAGGIILLGLGFNPLKAYQSLVSGAFGSKNAIAETILKAMPLIFTGLSFGVARKCGLINLGAEGQFYVGALAATMTGTMISGLPAPVHIFITLVCGFLGGAFYGALIGVLKVRFRASELITTIMFNYIATYFVSYCVTGPLKDPANADFPQSAKVLESAQLPRIFEGTRLHAGLFVVLLALIFYAVFLNRTTKGYELRVVGQNPEAAKYAGINAGRNATLSMFLAGGFAGLGGCVELIGVQYILRQNFSTNYGFDGIAVALLGNCSAVGTAISGVLFGMLRSGSNKMQMIEKVPGPAIYMIQGMIIMFVVGRELFHFHKRKKGGKAA